MRFFSPTVSAGLSLALAAVMAGNAIAAPKSSPSNPAGKSNGGPALRKGAASADANTLLDTAAVRKLYLDGDFDEAIAILETGLKEKRAFDHKDSVFIFKHLGVMYAAKYDTRERGKYFMHQLLMVEPTAKILDMYASDMIYMIFKNIQDEFEATRGRLARAEEHVNGNRQTGPTPASSSSSSPSSSQEGTAPERASREDAGSKGGGHALYWIGATGVVVAAGVAAFFLMSEKPKGTTDHSVQ